MARHINPRISTNGLVFAYDMANTEKSWRGAPTTNLITNPLPDGTTTGYVSAGGTGTTTYDSVNQAIKWVRTTYETWGAYHYVNPQFNGNLNTSTPYTISFEWRTEGNVFNNSVYSYNLVQGNGLDIAGSAVLLPNSTLQSNGWYLFKYTFTPSNTGVTAFNRIVLPSQGTNVSTFYWRKIQFEQQPFAVPFVNGTRTNTQSIIDLTGNNTVTVSDLTYAADNTFSFDGTNDSINFQYDLRSTWTYECWALHNVVNGFSFLGQGTTTANNGLHIWFRTDSIVRFGMYSSDTDSGTLTTSTGVWYHYVFTYNHATFQKQIYRNAVLSVQGTNTQYTGTGTVRIGATYSAGGNYANGRISNAKLYNRILTADEVSQNFNALRGRFGI